MDCHQKIKLALAADLLLAQQVVVALFILLSLLLLILLLLSRFYCRSPDIFVDSDFDDCQQAEAEKAKAAAPPPGVN